VNEAAKGGQGGGTYFPLTAVQRWDSATMQIENGVYLGQIAALTLAASAHGPLCCPTWGNAREEAAAEVISSTGRGAFVQGPPWQGGQHAARRCSSTDTHGLEQAWQMAVAPVPCMLTQPTSAAAAAAEPSAARTRAVWAGPLGAVRALDRPSCAGRWQHRERQAVTLRGHLMQTQVCTL